MRPTVLNALDTGVPNNGTTSADGPLYEAIKQAFQEGHRQLFLPGGSYLLTRTLKVDYPVRMYGPSYGASIVAGWNRAAGEAALHCTGANGGAGSLENFSVKAANGTRGGVAVMLDAMSGVYGANNFLIRRLYISGQGASIGEWDWAITLEGRHNNDPGGAVGLRATHITDCQMFNVRYGYIYCARAIQAWITNCGMYAPMAAGASGPQAEKGYPGVAVLAGSERVLLSGTPN